MGHSNDQNFLPAWPWRSWFPRGLKWNIMNIPGWKKTLGMSIHCHSFHSNLILCCRPCYLVFNADVRESQGHVWVRKNCVLTPTNSWRVAHRSVCLDSDPNPK